MTRGSKLLDGFAFYDFDGTLVSSNIVTQYAWYARNHPSRWRAGVKTVSLVASIPLLIALDLYSRRLFNEIFYRKYRGMRKEWLVRMAENLFESILRPAIYPGAKNLVDSDRATGFRTVLVTGSLDFAVAPVAHYFKFDYLISNSMKFEGGVATGEIEPPVIAEHEKVAAMLGLCRQHDVDPARSKAYSDSISDLPMLEAVGQPCAANPDRRLRLIARKRDWPVLNLK